jgi:hypothetical protein
MTDVAELYEQDFYAWTRVQAAELRRLKALRPNVPLDIDHIAEEIEDLGTAVRKGVRSQVRRILAHFLKLHYSPSQEPRAGWEQSIFEARDELADDLTAALRRDLEVRLGQLYVRSRRAAAYELCRFGEANAAAALPDECPYTLEDVLRDDWYPEPLAGSDAVRRY